MKPINFTPENVAELQRTIEQAYKNGEQYITLKGVVVSVFTAEAVLSYLDQEKHVVADPDQAKGA